MYSFSSIYPPGIAGPILGAQFLQCKAERVAGLATTQDKQRRRVLGAPSLSTGPVCLRETLGKRKIDREQGLPDHECVMPLAVYERERRSSRMFMRVRVLLAGKNQQGRRFRHACETIVINAHGALLYFDQDLEVGSVLVLINPFTHEDQVCRVGYLGDDSDMGVSVGMEFLTPSPHFWGVEFTHPDWTPAQTSSLAKN
jgi:hypothetical protein